MISLIIPVLNYEKKLRKTIESVENFLAAQDYSVEIIFVNDGSTDGTSDILRQIKHPNIFSVHLSRNMGKGKAVKEGIGVARGDRIIFTDIDLPYDLSAVEEAKKKFDQGYEVVLGSRDLPSSESSVIYGLRRKISSYIFSKMANMVLLRKVTDTQCGFKGFSRRAAKDIFDKVETNGFSFDVETIYLAQQGGYKIALIPVKLVNHEESSVNLVLDSLKMTYELVRLYVRLVLMGEARKEGFSRADTAYGLVVGELIALLFIPVFKNLSAYSILAQKGLPTFIVVLVMWLIFVPAGLVAGLSILHRITFLKSLTHPLGKYAVTGLFNTVLNMSIFNFFILMTGIAKGLPVILFAIISFCIVVTNSFFWNKWWVFRSSRAAGRQKKYLKFFAVSTVVALFNISLMHIMINIIGSPEGITLAEWANIAVLITIPISVIGNFAGYKFFVFK